MSRVYEGMHYPRDIAVGAGVGVGLASVYMRMLPGLKEFLKRQPALLRLGYMGSIGVALSVATKSFAEHARRGTSQSDLAAWAESAVASNPAKHAPKKATGRTPSMASLAVKPTTGSSGHGELPNLVSRRSGTKPPSYNETSPRGSHTFILSSGQRPTSSLHRDLSSPPPSSIRVTGPN